MSIFSAGDTAESRQLAQLKILYDARGRRLEEIDKEYRVFKEETDREIRILKHRLALTEDERTGMSGSLENCQQLLQEAQRQRDLKDGQISTLQAQIKSLTAAKEEVC